MQNLFQKKPYHSLSIKETLEELKTSMEGLTDFEAQGRIDAVGKNKLPEGKKLSSLRIFLRQFHSPLMYIIMAAALASFAIGHLADSIFIIVVIFINTTVGFFQERKAERALESLKKSETLYCRVIREGIKKEIASEDLAIGDIFEISAGDKVPADGRIIENHNLKVNEAMLTGEWLAVSKNGKKLNKETVVSDQPNMVFRGTIVEEGKALCVTTAVGLETQMGNISDLVSKAREVKTPLQKKFDHLAKWLGAGVLITIAIFAFLYFLRGEPFEDIITTSIALVVSAIPEGILPAITVVLVFGMRRLARKKALVRKLNSNETMGSITVICMDKTGTLTTGEMQVSHILTGARELLNGADGLEATGTEKGYVSHMRTLEIATLVNDAFIENPRDELSDWIIRGRPTDRALFLAGITAGIEHDSKKQELKMLKEVSFDSKIKYAVRAYEKKDGKVLVYMMGAPEIIVSQCRSIDIDGTFEQIDSEKGVKIIKKAENLSSQGLRTLACAWKEIGFEEYKKSSSSELIKEMNLSGFIALKDSLRSDAKKSVAVAQKAGIRPIIITGDHKNTAISIMKELGIITSEKEVIEGKDLKNITEKELRKKVKKTTLFARVMPEDKIRIVKALQENGEVVAMVGDGINDAPALKAADVGVALGSGMDIAREVSDIILLDDGFSAIVKAIEQGRLIIENIRRIVVYLIADDFSELFLFFSTVLFGFPLPLHAVQILWINVVEDGFPDIALTAEKDTHGIMNEKPRDPKEPILNRSFKKFMAVVFLVSGIAAMATFFFGLQVFEDIERTRTMVFVLIAFDSLVFAYIVRSFKYSVIRKNIFSNKILNIAVIVSLLLLIVGIYFPPLANFLKVIPLGYIGWATVVGISMLELLILETFKRRIFR